ncbi:MAG TPA: hypothetical protein VE889_04660 [Actinomycetota bacterium]|nr:hypothetical protein [Actinomycetota bacterium]
MEVRFYIDPDTGEPHLHRHGVTEVEAEQVLANPVEDRPGAEGARVFVVTSFELTGKPLEAFRRRRRRKI